MMSNTVIIIVIIITIIVLIKIPHYLRSPAIFDLNDVNDGDLVFFKWHTVDWLHELISTFTHVGIVVTVHNRKYILETHHEGDTSMLGFNDGGVHLYDMNERIHKYEGYNWICKLKTPLTKTQKHVLYKHLPNYFHIPFTTDYKKHFINHCLLGSSSHSKDMFCSQFVCHVLQDIGLIDKNTNIDCMTPDMVHLYTGIYQLPSLVIKKNDSIYTQ